MLHNVLDTEWGIESQYFRVEGWDSEVGVIGCPQGVSIPFVTPYHPNVPSLLAAGYESELQNVEINLRRPLFDRLNFLVGVRYLELKEEGLAMAISIGPGNYVVGFGIGGQSRLFGAQVGADGCVWHKGRFELGYMVKAGIYNNDAENVAFMTLFLTPTGDASKASKSHVAFVGETGIQGVCHLTQGLAIRAGYQLLWVEGVALASDQVSVSDPHYHTATVDTTGSVFYHGAFAGLEFRR